MSDVTRERLRSILIGFVGIIGFLGSWEAFGRMRLLGLTLPPFSSVVAFLSEPTKSIMVISAAIATTKMVALGYILGSISGVLVATTAHFCKLLRPGLDRFASLLHSVPTIALAPVFIVWTDRAYTGVALSAISVFFVVYVALSSGVQAVSKTGLDVFRALGAPRRVLFYRFELPSALPALVSGFSYAVPTAFVGVILGEWFGAGKGIGLLMVTAMQNFQIPLLWAAVSVISIVSLCAYGAMALLARNVERRYR